MAYLGVGKIGPNHPFSHDQISFVQGRSTLPKDSPKKESQPEPKQEQSPLDKNDQIARRKLRS